MSTDERDDDPIFASTVDVTRSEAVKLLLGDRFYVDINFESNGSSTMTVQVSNDGHEWHDFDSQDLNDSQDVFQYEMPWTYVRAFADANLQKIEISSQRVA